MPGHHDVAAPHKDEDPGRPGHEVFKGQEQDDSRDSQASGYGTQADAERKEFARLAALLALHGGHSLVRLDDGTLMVTRWNLAKYCADLQTVAQFARQLGAPA